MQDTTLSRWLSPALAFCLSFILITTLAPMLGMQTERQFDFWLLWLGAMIVLALPIAYLEIGLAKRSQTSALQALSNLTRDADASARWRVVGWLAVVFVSFLAGRVLSSATQLVSQQIEVTVSSQILFAIFAMMAMGLSFVPRQLLVLLASLGVITAFIFANRMGMPVSSWQWTAITFNEWGNATVLALVATGLGLGVYWQSSLAAVKTQAAASSAVLPIWLALLLAVVTVGFFAVHGQLPVMAWVGAAILTAALLIQFAKAQLVQRQIALIIQWVIIVAALAVWAISQIEQVLNPLLMLWGLVICLIYAIFAGWIMKISHLRKAMNFSTELFYNLWRIAVRVVLPLAIVLAMLSLLGQQL